MSNNSDMIMWFLETYASTTVLPFSSATIWDDNPHTIEETNDFFSRSELPRVLYFQPLNSLFHSMPTEKREQRKGKLEFVWIKQNRNKENWNVCYVRILLKSRFYVLTLQGLIWIFKDSIENMLSHWVQ